MRAWRLSPSGVLGVVGDTRWLPATAEQIYASVVEHEPVWEDLPVGRSGAAAQLSFSPYPVDAVLVLRASADARPAIRFQGRTQHGRSFPLSSEAITCGHVIHEDTWYPVAPSDVEAITELLVDAELDPENPCPCTLRQCLALRRAAASGGPVLDELPDSSLLNLAPTRQDDAPMGVAASLYPYQLDGWRWLQLLASESAGGLLADEMGLGKTLQIISVLRDPGTAASSEPTLVVAPGSLLENWVRELSRFAPDLRWVKHHGPERTGSPAGLLSTADVVVTSYDTATRDLSLLSMIRWNAVVLDEAQNIRNPATRRAKAVKRLHRRVSFAVTGTPVENRLRDLWSIMDFAMPDYLGKLSAFESRYEDSAEAASALEPLVSPLILRRRVREVANDLPPRIDIPEVIQLREDEALAYDAVRVATRNEYGDTATFVSLMRLRQFCAHPSLVHDGSQFRDYSKFRRLAALLGEILSRREKALVFTSFTAMADRVVEMVQHELGVLSATIDGRRPIPDRQPIIDEFTAYRGPAVLVLNPRAGGTGLNISAANHVIQYNPEWNPAIEDQAAARAYRLGQERPVTVRRLIVAGTVEEVMDERLQRKRAVANSAVVGVRGHEDDYRDIVAALSRSPMSTSFAP